MLESVLPLMAGYWYMSILVVVAAVFMRNHFHHGLNRYPGPIWAGFTNWWRFFDVWNRRPDITHNKLHHQYGDIVRLGPNALSFADPKAIKQIYGLNKGFVKVGGAPDISFQW